MERIKERREGKGGRIMKPFCKERATKVPKEERLMWYLGAT